MRYSPLLTDLYELTMLAGYLEEGMAEKPAAFDLFFRKNPFEGGYAVFAGLEPALAYLEELHFLPAELEYLRSLRLFKPRFLDFLRDFRFRGTVIAPPEGTVVFANEPLLTVEGTLAEAQFVETALLNIINFQTLIASKAARIVHAAAGAPVLEFGLRRAHGPDGGLSCARAACVGGVRSTSNVLAGMVYDLPVRGTHAHSWVQAFPDELTAFRAYADAFPASTILLVDTCDTLQSGIPNAITVARELREKGHELRGVRLDSGDLAFLSRESRKMFDARLPRGQDRRLQRTRRIRHRIDSRGRGTGRHLRRRHQTGDRRRQRRRCSRRRLQTGRDRWAAETQDHQRHRQGDPAGEEEAAAGAGAGGQFRAGCYLSGGK